MWRYSLAAFTQSANQAYKQNKGRSQHGDHLREKRTSEAAE